MPTCPVRNIPVLILLGILRNHWRGSEVDLNDLESRSFQINLSSLLIECIELKHLK